jgi:hypothetical protein
MVGETAEVAASVAKAGSPSGTRKSAYGVDCEADAPRRRERCPISS